MPVPSLLGRRVHLCGSISKDSQAVPVAVVEDARNFVSELVVALLRAGASFVVPVNEEQKRDDGLPICFDWLVLKTIRDNLHVRPAAAQRAPRPLVVGVQHHKTEAQVPEEYQELWDQIKDIEGLMLIENAGHWNMNSKRMDLQAMHGDILLTLGGDEGVLYLANLYHEAGRPVIPLNLPITEPNCGSLRLWELALIRSQTHRFFRTADNSPSHDVLNRMNFTGSTPTARRVQSVVYTLEALQKPIAFAVRLLNPAHEAYMAVENYFTAVVKPVAEERGYELRTVDGARSAESIVNLEIFKNLHYSSLVVADVTGDRLNNYVELGYALGRGLAVLVMACDGTKLPFDTSPVPTNFWKPTDTIPQQQEQLRRYWTANEERRRIVETDPLVP